MPSSSPFSNYPSQASATDSEGDVLVRVEGVSKIFCRDLKKSLLYGLQDSARDLLSWGKKSEFRDQSSASSDDSSSSTLDLRRQTSSSSRASGSRALRHGEFLAVDNVSFELRRGECLGLIGHNGAGKTTLLKMLNGLIKPDAGRIEMRGRVGALIALGAGFNPILSGRENIYVNGSILGLAKSEIDAKIEAIIEFAEISEFIDAPVQSYSSGMQVRLGFAVATAMEPDILLVDEVLAVGDFNFRWKCLNKIRNLMRSGVSIILVSHNAADLARTCQTGLFLKSGRPVFFGVISDALSKYENESVALKLPALKDGHSTINILDLTVEQLEDPPEDCYRVSVTIFSVQAEPRTRVVVGLHHPQVGALFNVSSYQSMGWLELVEGENKISLKFSGVLLQATSCIFEISVRGQELDQIYDYSQKRFDVGDSTVKPDYNGFGLNGLLRPRFEWQATN